MHKTLFLFMLLPLFSPGQEKPLPEELKPFVRSGYEVLDWGSEDLNADQRKDYVLILKKAGEDSAGVESDDWAIARPFLLITRDINNKLTLAAENNELVLCRHCGGAMGDPYEGLTLSPGKFQLDFYGGSVDRWAVSVYFSYDRLKKDWLLEKEQTTNFNALDPEKGETETTLTRKETGDITLKNYQQEHNKDNSDWLVKQKTWFYDSPELNSRPRKAYLIKGDRVKSWYVYKNFIRCMFENKNGTYTSGYILKKDLQRLPAQKAKAGQ
jgi:hypothetical protein